MNKQVILSWVVVGVIVILAVVFFILNKNKVVNNTLDEFAQCTAKSGLTMYGAVWCPHCQKEKEAFGDSFKYVKYVECPENEKLCLDLGITGFPTWIAGDGKHYVGEQGLKKLSEISGCLLPQ